MTNVVYSIDEAYFDLDSIHEVCMRLDETDDLQVGSVYWLADLVPVTAQQFATYCANSVIDTIADLAYDEISEMYGDTIIGSSDKARNELTSLLAIWLEYNTNIASQRKIGNPTTMTIDQSDIDCYRG